MTTGELETSNDERLSQLVTEAISRSEPIRAIAMDGLTVEARGGVAVLKGLIPSDAHRYLAEQLAAKVPGVRKVVNRLVTNDEMERRVSVALASDQTTRGARIAVRVVQGTVRLYGVVPTAQNADTVASVARGAAEGADVLNHLQVVPPGEPVTVLWQNSLEGRRTAEAAKPAPAAAEETEPAHPAPAAADVPPAATVGGTA